MEEKLTKMVSFLQIVWLLAWTPYAMMHCWIMFFNASRLSPIVGMVPCFCCKISAATNAMLYGLRYSFFLIELPVYIKNVYVSQFNEFLRIIFDLRLPKFKKEVKKMILASLPEFVTRRCLPEDVWRSYIDENIFLSRGSVMDTDRWRNLENVSGILHPRSPYSFPFAESGTIENKRDVADAEPHESPPKR